LLDNHWRSDWEWTDAKLAAASERLDRWTRAVAAPSGPPAADVLAEVRAAIADDLQTPRAIAAVDRWVTELETRGGADSQAPQLVRDLVDALLGVAL